MSLEGSAAAEGRVRKIENRTCFMINTINFVLCVRADAHCTEHDSR